MYTSLGHGLAKVLGIKLDTPDRESRAAVTRGESVFSVATADSYLEDEPTVAGWFRDNAISGRSFLHYLASLFPFTTWIGRYNLQWLVGDLIAGITIGAVVVPQGMGYAKLAELPVQFGLYAAFMGTLIYWFFATSKDITIGPVAVMSLLVGTIVDKIVAAHPEYKDDPQVIAYTLAILGGSIVFSIGLLRLGWIIEFISLTSVSAFITGSAINVICGQIGNLMGTSGYFNTRASTYLVIINSLKYLPKSNLNAALGLTSLFLMYFLRWTFNTLARKQPQRRKLWFFCNTMRTVFTILLYTFISWLVNRNLSRSYYETQEAAGVTVTPFSILGTVPRGFTEAGVPQVDKKLCSLVAQYLPAIVIVMLVEHISIAKSFGRINNYTINPSQEMLAIGITNLLGPFLGGYPATGSFSRTAIKSKAGVRTPLAGVITAIVVLLAIYALPAVFFYIPSAALSGVIIHAVGDLITPPNTVYQFWKISPLEVPIFFAGVIVMIFTTIEDGVYVVVAVSAALLLYRIIKARGRFLGMVKVRSVTGEHSMDGNGQKSLGEEKDSTREIFLPINAEDGSNPRIQPQHPAPGIFIFRFNEGFNYPNASNYLEHMVHEIFEQCQRTNKDAFARPGDRPWNMPVEKHPAGYVDERPHLKAVILDFASVNNVDVTSVSTLIDVRNQLDRFAAPDKVQWHFAHINNRWTRRALASAGFGFPTSESGGFERWKPVFSVAELGGSSSAAAAAEVDLDREVRRKSHHSPSDEERGDYVVEQNVDITGDNEKHVHSAVAYNRGSDETRVAVIQGLNRPFFHIDLTSALQSAIANADVLQGRTGRVESIDETGKLPDVIT